jgi:flavin reductase (DIM6/NTAB) family NADH-FMN oxidoreductase RutF
MPTYPTEPGAVAPAAFRRALAELASGVVVVTSETPGGEPVGLTATSVCSVSLTPPLVLACIGGGSATGEAIRASGRFALNVLSEDQRSVAGRFAVSGVDKFAGLRHEAGEAGLPLLEGCLAACECEVERTVEAGDHAVFIGRVLSVRTGDARGAPLLWFRRDYGRLLPHGDGTG